MPAVSAYPCGRGCVVTGITFRGDNHHFRWFRHSIRVKIRFEAMSIDRKLEVHSRTQRIFCVVALFAAFFSVVPPVLCAPRDCMLVASEPAGDCHRMPMEGGMRVSAAPSKYNCCTLSQSPLTTGQPSAHQAFEFESLVVALDFPVPQASAQLSGVEARFTGSPLHDVQSVLCTLLI